MNIWHDIDNDRIKSNDFICVIEISKNSKNKYEVDKATGMLILDRILYTSTHYPANYGFIPRTFAEDGDPMDVLVLCTEPIAPLSLVRCYPIGMISMTDEGDEDIKIVAIPFKDPTFCCYQEIEELPPHVINEIRHFFNVYKQLEGKKMVVQEMKGKEFAMQAIEKSLIKYEELYC